jgi:Tfp pilus assembly protein PilO
LQEFLDDEKNKFYATVGVTVLAGALYTIFALVPKVMQFYEMMSTTGDLKRKVEFVEREGKHLDKLKERLENLKAEDDGYSERFPSQKDIPDLLEDFASVARKSDVNIQSITPIEMKVPQPARRRRRDEAPAAREAKKYFDEIPILITAKSGYHQLGHFVNDLETGDRLLTIGDLQIQSNRKDPWEHNAKIVLKAYVSVEDEGNHK